MKIEDNMPLWDANAMLRLKIEDFFAEEKGQELIEIGAKALLKAEAGNTTGTQWDKCLPGYKDCLRRKIRIVLTDIFMVESAIFKDVEEND